MGPCIFQFPYTVSALSPGKKHWRCLMADAFFSVGGSMDLGSVFLWTAAEKVNGDQIED